MNFALIRELFPVKLISNRVIFTKHAKNCLIAYAQQGYSANLMNRRYNRLLLAIVAVALVFAPLRVAFAFPVKAADVTPHCAQMQDNGHAQHALDRTPESSKQACEHGCGGDCCDGACSAAAGSVALTGPPGLMFESHRKSPEATTVYSVTRRSLHPPFRPPIFLHS